ncbi:hypothetical protein [Longimicrobium terrae]|uniref:TonB C-terminal domain-containing protein n=1 Tax=Longimicrobium terrae TaxID=1639882 RepID=A0A841H0B0_9BACT|nr:hypothetical protein [Longimicrobium terrae]MBB4636986.1 hypothetical protein [Longimicrobium terrae]MBB6071406.1 hypothetical protein [Longimicrobium terrae]NNC31379.1 hypothetical protein [Longimicrobium terrae]
MNRGIMQVASAFMVAGAVAACDGRSGAGGREPVAITGKRVSVPASRALQRATGLTQIPRPRDPGQLTELLDQHYPRTLRDAGRVGAVLLDVRVDETGIVREALPVSPPPLPAGSRIRAVAQVTDPRTGRTVEEELPNDYDMAFAPAAQQALLASRFTPAIRDGQAVPYTVRMTVRFGQPAPPR